jgi:tetratricopeptide (TPR) repeat protein
MSGTDVTETASRAIGWKAIGAAIGRDARTARRWERERALPVNRVTGGGRDVVWADRAELARWMLGTQADASPDPDTQMAAQRTPRRWQPALAAAAVAAIAAAALFNWPTAPSARTPLPVAADVPSPYPDDRDAALFREASYAQASRTPAGLDLAAQHFGKLAAAHPDNPAALVGLAETWLLMREFGRIDSEVAFRRAREASEAALRLAPDNPDATRTLAFVLFWSESDAARGLRLFDRAARLAPADARTHHWRGNALAAAGQLDKALAALAEARRLRPELSAIAADEAWQYFLAGWRPQGIARLEAVTRIDPGFIGGWRYLELARLSTGDDRGFLETGRVHARLKGDQARLALLDQAEAALARGGRPALLSVLLEDARQRQAAGQESLLTVARLSALTGDVGRTRDWLERARAAREPYLGTLAALPEFQDMVNRPELKPFFRPG